MEIRACCKINLGLRVLRRRPDGFHDIETAMIAVRGLFDTVSVRPLAFVPATPPPYFAPPEVATKSVLETTGDALDCPSEENICMRALRLLQRDFGAREAVVKLHKNIPSGAGLGGGSSDAAAVLLAGNQQFALELTTAELEKSASELGSDVAFFVRALGAGNARKSAQESARICTGRGEILTPLELDLSGLWLAILKPADVAVSTSEAYTAVDSAAGLATGPRERETPLAELLQRPIEEWKTLIVNDFEPSVFARHPGVGELKNSLYDAGAVYASMSGSGSAVFGIFEERPKIDVHPDVFRHTERL